MTPHWIKEIKNIMTGFKHILTYTRGIVGIILVDREQQAAIDSTGDLEIIIIIIMIKSFIKAQINQVTVAF